MSLTDKEIALNQTKIGDNKDYTKLFNRIKAVEKKHNTKTKKTKEAELIAIVPS